MSISESTLALAIDGGCSDAIELLALLTLLGYCVSDAMHSVRDAVHCGLVHHAE